MHYQSELKHNDRQGQAVEEPKQKHAPLHTPMHTTVVCSVAAGVKNLNQTTTKMHIQTHTVDNTYKGQCKQLEN